MNDTEKLNAVIYEIVKTCLPIKLQRKVLYNEPFTHEEEQQLITVFSLADKAHQIFKSRERRDEQDQAIRHDAAVKELISLIANAKADFAKVLDRLNRKVNQSLDNEREILYHVSDDKESYAVQKDLRRPNSFKEAILQVTLGEIAKRPQGERRAVALKFFNEFKGYPEFYHDFKIFMRQIDRMRKSSLPKG